MPTTTIRKARLLCALATATACAGLAVPSAAHAEPPRRTIVVTTSVLGALVRDLAGERFDVQVAIPNGLDPHDWEPSAKDVERLTRADLVVVNGLGLEEGLENALAQARRKGVRVFTAADHVAIRKVEYTDEASKAHDHGAGDPHLWTDPMAMKAVAGALVKELQADFGVDLGGRLSDLDRRLDALDADVRRTIGALPADRRKLVTGHESLGYFAGRYGLKLVGAVVPGLSSQAETSAAELAGLRALVARERVKVLFTEVGTPPRLVEALARDSGVRCVPLNTHAVPADGSYFTFLRELAGTITRNLG